MVPIKVAISGCAGAGKTTVIRNLVDRLGRETGDIGQIFRKRAVEKNTTVGEYDKYVEQHPQEDILLDNEFKQLVQQSKKSIIVSRRMGFYFMPEIESIFLYVDPQEGARRILTDDRGKQEPTYHNIEEVIASNHDREQRLRERIQKLYGFDYLDTTKYKKVIDTTNLSVDEVMQQILDYLKVG